MRGLWSRATFHSDQSQGASPHNPGRLPANHSGGVGQNPRSRKYPPFQCNIPLNRPEFPAYISSLQSNASVVISICWKGTVFLTKGGIFHSPAGDAFARSCERAISSVFQQTVFFSGSHSQCQGSLERNSHHCRSTLNSKLFHCSPYRRSNAYLVGPQIKFAMTVALPEMLYRSNGTFRLNAFI